MKVQDKIYDNIGNYNENIRNYRKDIGTYRKHIETSRTNIRTYRKPVGKQPENSLDQWKPKQNL